MTIRRRTFMMGALSLPAASVAMRLAGPGEGAGNILLISDAEIPEAARFSQQWSFGAARVLSFEGDITALLFGQLVPMWRQGIVGPIGGLTDLRAFFYLSHAAGDFGLRLTYRSVRRDDGAATQDPTGRDFADWPSQTAHGAKTALAAVRNRALPISELLPDEDGTLVSWLMVPRGRLVT